MPTLLAAAAVSRAWRAAATADKTWARFNINQVANTYQHLIEALGLISPLERQLWNTPESAAPNTGAPDWARLLWDANCDPSEIQKWSVYTQLLLVSGRYRYDIFEHQVTNRRVVELAVNVPLTYQHYAAFEHRGLLLKSIRNRLPEHMLKQLFDKYNDDYEIQMAVASFHGDFFYEYTDGRRELLLAALACAPTRPPTRLARTKISDMELLKATTQVWDYHALYLNLSPELLKNPQARQFCGPKLIERGENEYSLGDADFILEHWRRPLPCGWHPQSLTAELNENEEFLLDLCALNDQFVHIAGDALYGNVEFLQKAIKRNPNVWCHIRDPVIFAQLAPLAIAQSYSLVAIARKCCKVDNWDEVLAVQPRRFARNRRIPWLHWERLHERSDYGPCIYRNRVARTEREHRTQRSSQSVRLASEYWDEKEQEELMKSDW